MHVFFPPNVYLVWRLPKGSHPGRRPPRRILSKFTRPSHYYCGCTVIYVLILLSEDPEPCAFIRYGSIGKLLKHVCLWPIVELLICAFILPNVYLAWGLPIGSYPVRRSPSRVFFGFILPSHHYSIYIVKIVPISPSDN